MSGHSCLFTRVWSHRAWTLMRVYQCRNTRTEGNGQRNICYNYVKQSRSLPISVVKRYPLQVNFIKRIVVTNVSGTNDCWQCGVLLESNAVFCSSCGMVQRPNPKADYFDVFQVNRTFDFNHEEIAEKYRNLQRILHPDKFSTKSEKEKQISEEYSSLVNHAYFILSQPLSRGLYLLELRGKQLNEGDTQMDPEFLMKIMKTNEALAEQPSVERLQKIKHANREVLQNMIRDVSLAFKNEDLQKALHLLAKMKYYKNIEDKVKDLEMEMGVLK